MHYLLTAIFIFFSSTLLASNTTQVTDSLLKLLQVTHSPEKRIQICRDLADVNMDNKDVKMYLVKLYQEASKVDDKKNMLSALNDIVIQEINANEYKKDSIVKYINIIKKTATEQELKVILPLYRMRIFDALYYLGNNEEAINEGLNFLDVNSNSKDDNYKAIASTYNMGVGLYMTEQVVKSIPYLQKAAELIESIPEKDRIEYQKFIIRRLCYAYGRTGKNKESLEKMDNLIRLVEKDYKIYYQKQRPFYKIELYLLQYYTYMICQLPQLTIEQEKSYWDKIQAIGKKITNDMDKYNYFLCANNYYYSNRTKKDMPKAIASNDSLIKLATVIAPGNLPGLYKVNSIMYEEIKDYKKALDYFKVSHNLQDSLNQESTKKQLNELQVKYDVNTLNNDKAQLELKNKKIILVSLSILLIVVITICTYLYFSWKKEKRMKMELKVLHHKAQESEKMKQSFINSICHEIRTPLNAIVGFSDLITNEEIDAEMRQEFPAEIQKNTILLTNLVNSMLEVANLDVSEDKLPCDTANLNDICSQGMELLTPKAGVEYKMNIPEENLFITTNAPYLLQVIDHLLNNANKFTEQGSVTLDYKVDHAEEKVYIHVTDTGCGIPLEKHEEVFNRFSKLDTFVPGNGLGLYLCRLIVKRLAGEIKIDPDYTEGTRMVVILPIK